MKLYKDEKWLFTEYITKNRTAKDIAEEVGVNRTTISTTLKKLGIVKDPDKLRETRIAGLLVETAIEPCGWCGTDVEQRRSDRERKGASNIFCNKACSGKHRSEQMQGKVNTSHPSYHEHPEHERWKEGQRATGMMAITKSIEDGTYGERLQKLFDGREAFAQTEEGIESLRRAGVKSVMSQRGRKSSIEILMENELIERGITYEEQFVVSGRFVSDFYLPDSNVIIECDGDYWHSLPDTIERDRRKDLLISELGIKLYRFREFEINEDVSKCVDRIIEERR